MYRHSLPYHHSHLHPAVCITSFPYPKYRGSEISIPLSHSVKQVLQLIIVKYELISYGFALPQVTQPTMMNPGGPRPEKFW
jgi:hypothetical protein